MKKKKKHLLLLLILFLIGTICPTSLPKFFSAVDVMAETKLPAPEQVSVKANDSSSITIQWNAVEGADGYRVYIKSGTKWTKLKTITNASTLSYTNKNLSMGTTYSYTVRAFKLVDGTRNWGLYDKTGKSATTIIPAPKLVSATALNTKSITVKWESVTGATGYRIYRKQANSSWTRIKTITGSNITSYTDSTLETGQRYYYTVRAYKKVDNKNVLGKYDKTGLYATTTITTPALVSIKSTKSDRATLTWKAVSGVSGYKIYRKVEGGNWQGIKTISGDSTTSYTHKSLVPGVTYYYTVRAYTLTPYTNTLRTTILSGFDKPGLKITSKTTKITDITFKEISATSIQVTWPETSKVDGYRVYRKTAQDTSWTKLTTLSGQTTTSYIDKTAEMGITYFYSVRGYKIVDGAKLWGYMNNTGKSFATAISVPELVSAQTVDHTTLKVTWKKVDGVDGYRIYRKLAGETKWTRIKIRAGADKVTYTDTGLNPATNYYYTVIAYKKIDGKAVLSKYNKYGVHATTKESPYSFENSEVILLKDETRDLALTEGTASLWKSSDSTVVSVVNGSITGHKAGKAIITAVVNGEELTCNVTVEEPSLPETFYVNAGETELLTLEGISEKVTWTINYQKYENMIELIPAGNNSVMIKASQPGTASISAKIENHVFEFRCSINVKGYLKPDKTALTIRVGERVDVNFNTNYYRYSLSSSTGDNSIASCYSSDYTSADYAVTIYGSSPGITTIRVAPGYDKETVYTDIIVTVIEKSTYTTGEEELIDYLKRNGTLVNGIYQFKLVRYPDSENAGYVSYLFSVGYEEAADTFHFHYCHKYETYQEEVYMSMTSGQTSNIVAQYQYTSDTSSFLAETAIQKNTYTGENVPFRLLKSEGIEESEISAMLETASKKFDSAFNLWHGDLLGPLTNTNMNGLGFTVYNSMN